MPLVTKGVTLGAVSLAGTVSGANPPHTGSVVVGDPPQWSDGSLATYATIHQGSADGYSGADVAVAAFGPMVPSVESVRSVEITATYVTHEAVARVDTFLSAPIGTSGNSFTYVEFPPSAAVTTATGPADSLETAARWLAEGGIAGFTCAAPSSALIPATCYELTVTVTYWTGQPPRRIFPRDDGLTGGAPRNYPPSKGVQSGNRAAGGYV